MRFCLLSGLVSIALISCQQDISPLNEDLRTDFFPLEEGRYWIYRVDSVIFDFAPGGTTDIDSSRSYILEEITGSFIDNAGNQVFAIGRSVSSSPDGPWIPADTWSAYRKDHEAFKKEGNFLFVKLVFPPSKGRKWDGNAYIPADVMIRVADEPIEIFRDWSDYEIVEEISSEEIAGTVYGPLVTVLQVDQSSLVGRRYSIEKFARSAGLVYKEMQILDVVCSGTPPDPCPSESESWLTRADRGFILRQVLIQHN